MTISETLKNLQKLSGLTQTELAQKIGVSFVAFNYWFNGKAEPRPKTRAKIMALYQEYSGEIPVPETELAEKKLILKTRSNAVGSVLKKIMSDQSTYETIMLSLTYHSNRIEGSTLSENETADIIFQNLTLPSHTMTEHLEAKNHQVALEYLFTHLTGNGQIDEAFILKMHGILMNGVRPDAGLYRQHGVRIMGVYVPTANYLKIPQLMTDWFLEVNKPTNDIIAKVARTHASFEQIHPFADGNGRIGRLLALAILLKHNCAPAIIRQENKRRYSLYLNQAQLKNSFSHLENFFCEAVAEGFGIMEKDS